MRVIGDGPFYSDPDGFGSPPSRMSAGVGSLSGGLARTGVGLPPFGMSGAGGGPSSDESGPTGVGQPPLGVGGTDSVPFALGWGGHESDQHPWTWVG